MFHQGDATAATPLTADVKMTGSPWRPSESCGDSARMSCSVAVRPPSLAPPPVAAIAASLEPDAEIRSRAALLPAAVFVLKSRPEMKSLS